MPRRDQTESGRQYAMKALKNKRASLAGEIESLKRKLEWAQKQMAHVDGCLTIFQPGFDPGALGIKKPRSRVRLFKQGELNRMVLDALRRAGKPIGTKDVTTLLMEAAGHGEDTRDALTERVRQALGYLARTNRIVGQNSGRLARWSLIPD